MSAEVAGPDGSELSEGLGQVPARWYCVSREGLATLCKDEADAHETVAGCDKSWPRGGPHRAVQLVAVDDGPTLLQKIGQLRHDLVRSGKLAEDRLQQMQVDRTGFLKQRDQLDKALTVCRCAARVVDSSAYQGVSDEDCDLENSVRNWRALWPNEEVSR